MKNWDRDFELLFKQIKKLTNFLGFEINKQQPYSFEANKLKNSPEQEEILATKFINDSVLLQKSITDNKGNKKIFNTFFTLRSPKKSIINFLCWLPKKS